MSETTTAPPKGRMTEDTAGRRHNCDGCNSFIEPGEVYLKRKDYARRGAKPRATERYHVRCGLELLEDEALNGEEHDTTRGPGVACLNVLGKTSVHRVRVQETEKAWVVHWSGDDTEEHPSAVEALEAVKAMAQALAGGNVSSVFVVEWETTTTVGKAVARVLTATR